MNQSKQIPQEKTDHHNSIPRIFLNIIKQFLYFTWYAVKTCLTMVIYIIGIILAIIIFYVIIYFIFTPRGNKYIQKSIDFPITLNDSMKKFEYIDDGGIDGFGIVVYELTDEQYQTVTENVSGTKWNNKSFKTTGYFSSVWFGVRPGYTTEYLQEHITDYDKYVEVCDEIRSEMGKENYYWYMHILTQGYQIGEPPRDFIFGLLSPNKRLYVVMYSS